jgi:PGF-CTERM protein
MTLVALAIFVLLAVLPASAATANATRIVNGATVFIGESGLNITGPIVGPTGTIGGTPAYQIAWFPSTAQTTSVTPDIILDVTATRDNFYVDAGTFGARTGNWYCWTQPIPGAAAALNQSNALGNLSVAFRVADPRISLAIWDLDQNKDISGKSVPAGERVTFKIDSNAHFIAATNARYRMIPPLWNDFILRQLPTQQFSSPVNKSFYGFNNSGQSSWGIATPNMTNEGFIDIKVKTADGATLTYLWNNSQTSAAALTFPIPIPLTGMFVTETPWYWDNATLFQSGINHVAVTSGFGSDALTLSNAMYWNTSAVDTLGARVYPSGTYTVTAEFNINSLKDNYKNAGADYTGKTISDAKTLTLIADTVAITASKDTVVRSKPFTLTITGKPNTVYYLWVKGTTAMAGNYDAQPPMLMQQQSGMYNDTAPYYFNNTVEGGVGNPYQFYVWGNSYAPQNLNAPLRGLVSLFPFNGTHYYAAILTNDAGTRTIQWQTSNQTKAQTYTFRAENWSQAGGFVSDEVDVKIEKGAVTITAAGDGSYYLGEEVKFSGTNTETETTWLFLTGPNLNAYGAQIQSTDPRNNAITNGAAAGATGAPQNAAVKEDNTWSYKWGTATTALDAGTYTVYATSASRDAAHLSDVAYGTVSIVIKKPFVSATASQATVAQGDKLFVRGTAEGKPSPGVQIWILGKNYNLVTTTSVNADASFEYEVKAATTQNLYAGQYFLVVQHPMQNNVFDIVVNGARVQNLQLGAAGQNIFTLTGAGSLQGSDAAEALVQAINDPNVDDTYPKLQFLIEVPTIRINAIGDKHVGDKFTITADTNLAVDDNVLFEVYSSSFKPTQKTQSGEFSGKTGTVKVTKGLTGMNKLSFDVDASTFKPDEYLVTANRVGQTPAATATALFNVLEGAAPTVAPTAVATTAAPATTAPPTQAPTTVAPTKTPTQPGFGAFIALIGLGAVAFLVVRRH